MKYLIILLISITAYAKEIKWSNLYKGSSYTLIQQIDVIARKEDFSIPKGSKLKLVDSTPLPMINVQLFKFALPTCPSSSMETELELLEVGSVVIGYDIAENCVLEIFIESKDLYSKSIFN